MNVLVVVEATENGFSAYSPDLPGCVAAAETREAVEAFMREAVPFHLDGLREDGVAPPKGSSYATVIEVAA